MAKMMMMAEKTHANICNSCVLFFVNPFSCKCIMTYPKTIKKRVPIVVVCKYPLIWLLSEICIVVVLWSVNERGARASLSVKEMCVYRYWQENLRNISWSKMLEISTVVGSQWKGRGGELVSKGTPSWSNWPCSIGTNWRGHITWPNKRQRQRQGQRQRQRRMTPQRDIRERQPKT